mmetsp:Transcript_71483/g.180712  ORF Transcript_71483/g.180712 Transcript_71483/m.180712 type:complete len:343 (-) Transcript_71483:148-1176(-)
MKWSMPSSSFGTHQHSQSRGKDHSREPLQSDTCLACLYSCRYFGPPRTHRTFTLSRRPESSQLDAEVSICLRLWGFAQGTKASDGMRRISLSTPEVANTKLKYVSVESSGRRCCWKKSAMLPSMRRSQEPNMAGARCRGKTQWRSLMPPLSSPSIIQKSLSPSGSNDSGGCAASHTKSGRLQTTCSYWRPRLSSRSVTISRHCLCPYIWHRPLPRRRMSLSSPSRQPSQLPLMVAAALQPAPLPPSACKNSVTFSRSKCTCASVGKRARADAHSARCSTGPATKRSASKGPTRNSWMDSPTSGSDLSKPARHTATWRIVAEAAAAAAALLRRTQSRPGRSAA